MKRIAAIALFAIANLALVSTSFAQSNGVKAEVPFAFTLGNTSLPAGTYTIKYDSNQVIKVTNNANRPSAALSLFNQAGRKSTGGGKLLFHRYGSQYFLSEILCDDAGMNLKIPDSKNEKSVRRQQASLPTSSDIMVATR